MLDGLNTHELKDVSDEWISVDKARQCQADAIHMAQQRSYRDAYKTAQKLQANAVYKAEGDALATAWSTAFRASGKFKDPANAEVISTIMDRLNALLIDHGARANR